MGIVLTGLAFYVCLAALFEAAYGRSILPLIPAGQGVAQEAFPH